MLRGELGGVAAMACDGGVPGARAGARPGSRRCGADAERSEAAWDAKNRSGRRRMAGVGAGGGSA